jgi:hypothetical protein
MRVFGAVLLSMGLMASPLLANNAKEAGTENAPARVITVTAEKPEAAAKPEPSPIESEVRDLRGLVEEQRAELESQRAALKAAEAKMEALEEKLSPASPRPVAVAASSAIPAAFSTPVVAATPATVAASAASPAQKDEPASPLQFRIGSAYITPVGFMDFTSVWRNHDAGSGIGTNFAGIPYGNTFNNHLSELRLSMQNSRIGFRVDALVKGARVMGYMESDFLGNNPGNVSVTSNSNTLRSRLYWVDVRKDKWEVLGGQTWSLITPGRTGISPLPGDIFYSQDIDVNYQAGLVWGRIPELRFVLHPTNKVAFAVALDSPEQYTGGSAGGSTITYPAALSALGGTQLNTGGSTLSTPNIAPDFIAKLAFDPTTKFHVELGGLVREFKVWNASPSPTGTSFSKTGGGGFINLNFELFKGFRLITNNFWSDGGGRYIFGQVPDLIVRADDSLSPIKAGSTVSGFEYVHKNTLLYVYYGGIYVQKNATFDLNGTTPIGYGFAGSPSGQNRAIQEETVGFNQTLWKDGKFGALNFMGQYSYLNRNPWATLNPKEAHINMVFLNLRYTLPGSAPTLGR